jgi:uncharacterized membrane protein YdjX (TVP38/TMEM64 family)
LRPPSALLRWLHAGSPLPAAGHSGAFWQAADDIHKGIEQEGAFYLFTLRLIPVGAVCAELRSWADPDLIHFLVSQIGMMAGTLVVNAGTQIAD